jgi:glycerophosphoryl diester phosphodiesterase
VRLSARILPVCLAVLLSCAPEDSVVVPSDVSYALPAGTIPFTPATRHALEGVYQVTENARVFGEFVVLRWSYVADGPDTTHYLSMFAGREVSYFVLQGGRTDSTLHFSGYWRKMTSFQTGNAAFMIRATDGGRALGGAVPRAQRDTLTMIGRFNSSDGGDAQALTLRYVRPLYITTPFAVIAHRGGGRNSDMLPASENTVGMILHAERFGASGVEIDVRMTSDNVPILFHDEDLTLRLNIKNGLVGPVESYSYVQLQTFVRLLHDETIPTLREVLDAVVDKTNLRFVWLDMKSSRASMGAVRTLQRAAMLRANMQAAAGRRNPLAILIGLPDQEKADEFMTLADHAEAPAICEISPEEVRRTGAAVWAPRWTLGTQPSEVAQMHAEGRKVVVWTLDVPQYIAQFVQQGDLDGILSNYPSSVAFTYFVKPPQ